MPPRLAHGENGILSAASIGSTRLQAKQDIVQIYRYIVDLSRNMKLLLLRAGSLLFLGVLFSSLQNRFYTNSSILYKIERLRGLGIWLNVRTVILLVLVVTKC